MRRLRLVATLALVMASIGCSAGGEETASTSGPPREPSPSGPVPADRVPISTDFLDVRIFDGHNDVLSAPSNVRVKGNHIERMSTDPLPADPRGTATVIDGAGRTLMPGLIDNHWHTMLVPGDKRPR